MVRNIRVWVAAAALIGAVAGQAWAADSAAPSIDELKKKYERPKDIPYPPENPYSEAKMILGKTLYFDPRISAAGIVSCATCHNPSFSWGDGLATATGAGQKKLGRKSPTVLNLAWDHEAKAYMWDGRKANLEEQALGPIESDVEMNMTSGLLLPNLKAIKEYKPLFEAAFPDDKDPINMPNIGKAIATYERTIVSGANVIIFVINRSLV